MAQTNLGLMYDEGRGILQDYKEAVKWYRLAAEQGNAMAQANLGLMYGEGKGVLQDYIYAHMWLNISASLGDEIASEYRGIVEKIMFSSQIEKAQKLARECTRKKYKNC